jgi:hypothetical protein
MHFLNVFYQFALPNAVLDPEFPELPVKVFLTVIGFSLRLPILFTSFSLFETGLLCLLRRPALFGFVIIEPLGLNLDSEGAVGCRSGKGSRTTFRV